MRVSKWGNSLAIRLPAIVVEALELREGDEIRVTIADARHLEIERKPSPDELLRRLDRFVERIPPDLRFDRDEANAR